MELVAIPSWPIAQHDGLSTADWSKGAGTVQDNVIVSHRGARYEIGRGPGFYGIWPAGAARFHPIEWWPVTAEGWRAPPSRLIQVLHPPALRPTSHTPPPSPPPPPS